MNYGIFHLFNLTFFWISLIAGVISAGIFLQKRIRFATRIGLLGGSLFSLLVSAVPALSIFMVIAFAPAAMYHIKDPLSIAPLMIGPLSVLGCWSLAILFQEFVMPEKNAEPLKLRVILTALILFFYMGYGIANGLLNYKIIFNLQNIIHSAATQTDPKQLKKIYLEVAKSSENKILNHLLLPLAKNPHSPPELLQAIYTRTVNSDLDASSRDHILVNLAENPNVFPELLRNIMLSFSRIKNITSNYEPLNFISPNSQFSQDKLWQLAQYPDCEIRRTIIAYPNISENILTTMIQHDPDVGVKRDAKNRLDFLQGISVAEDNDDNVSQPPSPVTKKLSLLARNSVDPNQLAQIYDQTEIEVHTDGVVENLAENCFISDMLARRIYLRANSLTGYPRTSILKALSVNPNTPQDILALLSKENDLAILRALVSNPSLSQDIITKFAPFPDCKIRKKLLCIPNTTNRVLTRLEHDADEGVALEAHERLMQGRNYLEICREIKELNPSCRKFYETNSAEVRLYPNTSSTQKFKQEASL
jgi:hypothetical protein